MMMIFQFQFTEILFFLKVFNFQIMKIILYLKKSKVVYFQKMKKFFISIFTSFFLLFSFVEPSPRFLKIKNLNQTQLF
jgi:hypothetical protein